MTFSVRKGREALRRKLQSEGVPPLAARILSARNIAGSEDIAPPLAALPPPDVLPDMEKLCDILAAAVRNGEKICVVGDYDADGMCATALAVRCLEKLGANVSWKIPDRKTHGYGLHTEIAETAAAEGASVLLTVDNGVAAADAVARAKQLGMKVCITDHHLPPPQLPDADCIVNPRLHGGESAGANLSGVGVAFYAMAALRTRLGAALKMTPFLDLVAVGCIADCMPMDATNRAMVGGGLARLRRGDGRAGLAALLAEVQPRRADNLSCDDIGHSVAPRINAAGRLNQTQTAMECLLAEDKKTAHKKAAALSVLNEKRKQIVAATMAQIPAPPPNAAAVIAADEKWQSGVMGIIAGKLADAHRIPALAFTRENGLWRGSGRAPPGRNLHSLVVAAAEIAPVINFGGHSQAVGVSLGEISPFAQAFTECCRRDAPAAAPRWQVDEMPPPEEITPDAVGYLERIVWGGGFARPLFAGAFAVSEIRPLGRGREHLRMRLRGGGLNIPALAFFHGEIGDNINAVFSLMRDSFNGSVVAVIKEVLD